MTVAADVLNVARGWLGTREDPDGSNHVPGITDVDGFYDAAWCDMFVSRVFTDAGLPHHHCAWVPAEMQNAENGYQGFTWIDGPGGGQPGDAILFNWLDGPPDQDHIGIVEADAGSYYVTIEGNVSDGVYREHRAKNATVAGFARPPYDQGQVVDTAGEPVPPPSQTGGRPVLRSGSTGDAVKAWQSILAGAGLIPADHVDGDFGSETATATTNFQARLAVKPDGEVGPDTYAATDRLMAYLAGLAAQQAAPPGQPPVDIPPFPGTVRYGSTGDPVRQVQQRLSDRGWSINIDGRYGHATEACVKAYQTDKGLTVDGEAGPATWVSMWTDAVT